MIETWEQAWSKYELKLKTGALCGMLPKKEKKEIKLRHVSTSRTTLTTKTYADRSSTG